MPVLKTTIAHRQQFVGFNGAPVTQKININAPVQSKSMGLGFKLSRDKVGATTSTGFSGVWAYHLGIGNGKLSFGLEGGGINYLIDFTDLIRTEEDDNALSRTKESIFIPDASVGLNLQFGGFSIGFASFHLIKSKLDVTGVGRDGGEIARLANHNFLNIGYKINASEKIVVEPLVLMKSVKSAPTQFDFNLNVVYNNLAAIGVGYRTGDGLTFLARYLVKEKIMVGYSYDYTLSELATYSSGTHEIMLGYQIKLLPPSRDKITDPRYYF
jgi:type IX secretion system PorP/SprF family membrane protein